MKKLVIFLLIVLFVLSLVMSIYTRAHAEKRDFNFFEKMAQVYDEQDCYIKMSIIDGNVHAGLVLYGPSLQKLSDLYLYNVETQEFAIVHAWAKDSADLQSTLLRVGIANPCRFIDAETHQLCPFDLLKSGIQLVFDSKQ